ncbi:hypothetical protein NPIL_452051 [Nephila pilipes]|uniref:Uncharacterized protein n=1 Tax=Nephila pilipes TaxID=299642 RepID=A0A8X6QYH9_NEPPI|nr:hypothetical protein NPIL_452051 [Nephila pilipes]
MVSCRNSRHVNFRSLENDWNRNSPTQPPPSQRVGFCLLQLDNKHSQIQSQISVLPSFFARATFQFFGMPTPVIRARAGSAQI